MRFDTYILPVVVFAIILTALIKKVDVFEEFTAGAWENMKVCTEIAPTLIGLMLAIGVFRASGALEALTGFIAPFVSGLGFPAECIPLALIRPVSGSGALVVFESILSENGPDSLAGKVASVLQGSTETTLYTIAVYFSVTRVKKIRHTLLCALAGDITGFICSAILVKILL